MFREQCMQGYREVGEGIRIKVLTYEQTTMLVEFRLKAGAGLPAHAHPHEQSGYLVSGHIELTVGDEVFDVHPGDAWTVAGNVPHQARTIEDSVAIEVFSPLREDFLD